MGKAPKAPREEDLIDASVDIAELKKDTITVRLLSTASLVMNRMTQKTQMQLLLPPRKQKNVAELEANLKHDPLAEFRNSIYRCRDENAPTLLHMPNGSFKKAIASTAIDTPGATKAQIGRLVTIESETVHVFGLPLLYMCPVRMADIRRTPDIRTRALIAEWAVELKIGFISSIVKARNIITLVHNAGLTTGVGDGRQEKGSLSHGLWRIVGPDDENWNRIVQNGGRAAQVAAMQEPMFADEDSEELFTWYQSEIIRREITPPSQPRRRRRGDGDEQQPEVTQ